MAIIFPDMDSPHLIVSPSPLLHCSCPPQAPEPSSPKVTGHRCWLASCVDFGNGHHHSHCKFSQLIFSHPIFVSLLNSSTIIPTENLSRNTVMVRHHMRSCREGTQGGSEHLQTMPNLEPVPPLLPLNFVTPIALFWEDTPILAVVEVMLCLQVKVIEISRFTLPISL